MRIVTSLEELAVSTRTVVAIGNFDGLHLGHRTLLAAVQAEARQRGVLSAALTFEPHPLRILRPDRAPRLITPLEEKLRCFASTGIDLLVVLPFSRDLSLLGPREFVDGILVRGLHALGIHEGANFRFGHRQSGNIDILANLGGEFGFSVTVHDEVRVRGEIVSSSRIRELVAAGHVEMAARLLGRPFALRGAIAQGHGIGRRLTVPTLNLQHYEELLPGNGVYVTCTRIGERRFQSLTNIGTRPTFANSGGISVETFLLDFEEMPIEDMEIRFLFRLRDERKFDTPAALKQQILHDVERGRRYFRRLDSLKKQ